MPHVQAFLTTLCPAAAFVWTFVSLMLDTPALALAPLLGLKSQLKPAMDEPYKSRSLQVSRACCLVWLLKLGGCRFSNMHATLNCCLHP